MSKLDLNIDAKAIAKLLDSEVKDIMDEVQAAAKDLSLMTHAKVLELSRDKLGSLNKKYSENVEFTNPTDNMWVITLKNPAMFIEEGFSGGFMEWLLEGKSAKVSKKGKRYAVIPFHHNKEAESRTTTGNNLLNLIRQEMNKKKIPTTKIETDANGSPRLGKIHTFDVRSPKLKPSHTSEPLAGVNIYQTKDPSTGVVRKDIMTFRVITEDHRGQGKWFHPGLKGKKLFDEAFEWANKIWTNEILPTILDKK